MRNLLIAFVLLCGLLACRKDVAIPEKTTTITTCPIDRQFNSSQNGTLKDTWRFVGFQDEGSSTIEYPPCRLDNNPLFSGPPANTISFPDSLSLPYSNSFSGYSQFFEGINTLNKYHGGCEYNSQGMLSIGKSLTTLLNVPEEYWDFEAKYARVLHDAKRYELNHNWLTIYYGDKGKMLFVLKN